MVLPLATALFHRVDPSEILVVGTLFLAPVVDPRHVPLDEPVFLQPVLLDGPEHLAVGGQVEQRHVDLGLHALQLVLEEHLPRGPVGNLLKENTLSRRPNFLVGMLICMFWTRFLFKAWRFSSLNWLFLSSL